MAMWQPGRVSTSASQLSMRCFYGLSAFAVGRAEEPVVVGAAVAQARVGLLDVEVGKAVPAPETYLLQTRVKTNGRAPGEVLADDLRGMARTAQRTGPEDQRGRGFGQPGEQAADAFRLVDATLGEWRVGGALEAALGIEGGLAVARKVNQSSSATAASRRPGCSSSSSGLAVSDTARSSRLMARVRTPSFCSVFCTVPTCFSMLPIRPSKFLNSVLVFLEDLPDLVAFFLQGKHVEAHLEAGQDRRQACSARRLSPGICFGFQPGAHRGASPLRRAPRWAET